MKKLVYLLILLQLKSSIQFQVVKLDKYFLEKKIVLKKSKTVKIQLSKTALEKLVAGEASLFWEMKPILQVRGRISAERYPREDDPVIEVYQKEGENRFNIFSKHNKKIFEIVKQNDGVLYLNIRNEGVGEFGGLNTLRIKLGVAEAYEVEAGKKYTVGVEGEKYVPIMMNFDARRNKNRVLKMRLEKALGEGYVEGFGNFENIRPSKIYHNFEFVEYSSKVYGFVVQKENAPICYVSQCLVYVLFKVHSGVEILDFASEKVLGIERLKNEQLIPDIIARGGRRDYKFTAPELGSIEIDVSPVEGEVALYATPGAYKKDLKKSMYIIKKQAKKRLIISKNELLHLGIAHKKATIYISVTSKTRASYTIQAKIQNEKNLDIKPGVVESGEVSNLNIKSHLLSFPLGALQKHEFSVKLHLISGTASLYIKECPKIGKCELRNKELEFINTSKFKKSDGKSSIETIEFPVYCTNSEGMKPLEGYAVSNTCNFGIFVKGGLKSGISHYELSVEDIDTDQLVLKNHYQRVKILEGRTKIFYYNFQNSDKEKKNLKMIFDGRYGKFKICVKISDKRSKNFKNCLWKKTVNSNLHGLATNFIKTEFGSLDKEAKSGKYYIMIRADTTSSLSIGVLERKSSSKTPPETFIARTLRPGISISGRISNCKEIRYYSFKITPGENIETLSVDLQAKRGKFWISMRNDDRLPTFENQEFWISGDNRILIDKDDPMFKDNAVYKIAVTPFLGFEELKKCENEKNFEINFEYQISFNANNKSSVLTPGIPETGILASDSKCFIIKTRKNQKNLLVMKTITSRSSTLYASINTPNFKPDINNQDFFCRSQNSAILLKKSKIEKKCDFSKKKECNIYLCLYGKEGQKFTLTYTYDNHPILVNSGESLFAPIPINGKELHFIHHPDRNKNLDIEEGSQGGVVSLYSVCVEEKKIKNHLNFPSEKFHQKVSERTGVHYSAEEMKLYKKPVCLVTAKVSGKFGFKCKNGENENFCMKANFVLSFTTGVKELRPYNDVEVDLERDQMKFFSLYNSEKKIPFKIMVESSNYNVISLFISRGLNSRPDSKKNLFSNFGWKKVEISVKEGIIKGRGYKDLRGHYVIGIKCNLKSTKVRIKWEHKVRSDIINARLNKNFEVVSNHLDHRRMILQSYVVDEVDMYVFGEHSKFNIYVKELVKGGVFEGKEIKVGKEDYDRVVNFEAENSFRKVTLKPKSQEFYKYLFTFVPNGAISSAQVVFRNPKIPAFLWDGESTFGVNYEGEKQQVYEIGGRKEIYVEIEINSEARILFLKNPWKSENGENFVILDKKQLKVGFNSVKITKQNSPRFFKIDCGTKNCHYKISIIVPSEMNKLRIDEVKLGMIPPTAKNLKYIFSTSNKDTHLDIRFRILRTYSLTGKYVPVKVTKDIAKKILSLKKISKFDKKNKVYLPYTLNPTIHYSTIHANIGQTYSNSDFILTVTPLENLFIEYEIEVSRHKYSTVYPNSPKIERILPKERNKIMEVWASRPGEMEIRLGRCFGSVGIGKVWSEVGLTKEVAGGDDGFFKRQRRFAVPKAGIYWFEIERFTNNNIGERQRGSRFKRGEKAGSAFSVEVVEDVESPFKGVKPGKLGISFSGHSPTIKFTRFSIPEESLKKYKFSTIYTVVISWDRELVEYYEKCNDVFLDEFYSTPESLKKDLQILKVEGNEGGMIEVRPDLKPGTLYHASVFADIKADRGDVGDGEVYGFVAKFHRLNYNVVRFETSSFMIPLEILSAIVGLIAITFMSLFLVKNTFVRYVQKAVGFTPLQSDDGEQDVDSDLEAYFMKMRNEEKAEEKSEEEESSEEEKEEEIKEINYDIEEVMVRKRERSFEGKKKFESPDKLSPRKSLELTKVELMDITSGEGSVDVDVKEDEGKEEEGEIKEVGEGEEENIDEELV